MDMRKYLPPRIVDCGNQIKVTDSFGTKCYPREKLVLDYFTMSNNMFFDVYGFNFVPTAIDRKRYWDKQNKQNGVCI